MPLHQKSIFQQDGAPAHTARIVREWFNAQPFELLAPWPGSCPDLNPIEEVWGKLKREIESRKPSSVKHLKDLIRELWVTKITPDYCESPITSMPRRISAVLPASGGYTKY